MVLLVIAGLCLLQAACHKEPTTASAANNLQRAFDIQAPPVAENPPTANVPSPAAAQGDGVKQAVSDAVIAMRNNNYLQAFTTLHAIQASPKLTLNQYSAIESARLAVERDLAAKAESGDPAALSALQGIKKAGH